MITHPELPPYGRRVGGLCIIDEALYRQTKLNRGACSSASEDGGGRWVGSVGEGVKSSMLTYFCICRKKGASVQLTGL